MSYRNEILLNSFRELFWKATGEDFSSITTLRADSSERKIFRLNQQDYSFIAVYNEHIEENIAYVSFTESFLKERLPVPKIIAVSDDSASYLVEDLGDNTLFRISNDLDKEALKKFHAAALNDLAMFQTLGRNTIDFSKSFPSKVFDGEIVSHDIEKFRKYFLPMIHYGRSGEFEFRKVTDILSETAVNNNRGFFMYRDFQPRNIMVKDDELFYIDFQSGMKGASQYDLASFLYSGSISLDEMQRNELIKSYCVAYFLQTGISENVFMEDFGEFVLMRLIQVLGSYAYVHHKKQKDDTLRKIPKALKNLSMASYRIKHPVLKEFAEHISELGMNFYS